MTIFSITQNIDSKFSVENLQFSWSEGIQILTRKHSSRCVPPAFVVPEKGGRVSQGVRYPRGGGYPRGRVYPPERIWNHTYLPPKEHGTRDTLSPLTEQETSYQEWTWHQRYPTSLWRWTDTHLSATSLAGGNNTTLFLGFAAIKCVKKNDNCRRDRQFDECGCSESPRYSLWDPRNLGLSSDGGQYLLMNIITS